MKIHEATTQYLKHIQRFRRPRTLEAAKQIVETFARFHGDTELEDLRADNIEDFVSSLPYAARTKANWHVRIMSLLKFHGYDRYSFQRRGLRVPERPRFIQAEPKAYADHEIKKFLSAARDSGIFEYVYFETLRVTGLRDLEAMFLEWPDFDGQTFHIRPKPQYGFSPKNGEERIVPVPNSLVSLINQLRGLRPGALIFPTKRGNPNWHQLRTCKRIARRAGLDETKWSLHGFRRTHATTLLRKGVNVKDVQKFLGHRNLQSTMRYLEPSRDLREIACKVYG
jgi:integrase/recombinase XerD